MTKEDWGHLSGGSWVSDNSATWAYDWVGNRNPSSNTYNEVDELNPGSGYVYDKLGNVEHDPDDSSTPRTDYFYTDDNLLKQVDDLTCGGITSTYMYWDADQQRVKLARGNYTWYYVYDPTAGIPAVLWVYDPIAHIFVYYVREPDGELLSSFTTAGTKRYHQFDNLGSTVLVTDSSGTVTDSFTYGAWGDVLYGASGQKPYQYVGELGYYTHLTDQGAALADLMQLGVRFYDPSIGRFTQSDPMGVGYNLYGYTITNPLFETDPSGMYYEEIVSQHKHLGRHCSDYVYIMDIAASFLIGSRKLGELWCRSCRYAVERWKYKVVHEDTICAPPGQAIRAPGPPKNAKLIAHDIVEGLAWIQCRIVWGRNPSPPKNNPWPDRPGPMQPGWVEPPYDDWYEPT